MGFVIDFGRGLYAILNLIAGRLPVAGKRDRSTGTGVPILRHTVLPLPRLTLGADRWTSTPNPDRPDTAVGFVEFLRNEGAAR